MDRNPVLRTELARPDLPTLLHEAIFYDLPIEASRIIRDYVEKGLGLPTDDAGYTPLHIAARYGNTTMLRMLVDSFTDLSPITNVVSTCFSCRLFFIPLPIKSLVFRIFCGP